MKRIIVLKYYLYIKYIKTCLIKFVIINILINYMDFYSNIFFNV